jgi:hypothetical protein
LCSHSEIKPQLAATGHSRGSGRGRTV